jgi:hypothetical protein
MERSHIFIVAAIAVLSLFGLKVWSDRTADSGLDVESRGADQRLARASGLRGGSEGSESGQSAGDSGFGRSGGGSGSGGPSRPGAAASGSGGGVGNRGSSGGSAESVRIGGSRLASLPGSSGERPGSWGSGGGVAGGGGGAGLPGSLPGGQGGGGGTHSAPSAAQKQMVDFLSSQAPTHQDLASAKPQDDQVALKLDKVDDISSQGGRDQNVQESNNGDGISIGADGVMQFPNNVSPSAATISFTFTPNWSGADSTDNALLEMRGEHDWSNRIELVKNGDFLRFIVTPSGGQESDISVRITDWQAGQPHDIQASYGDSGTVLSIDGVQRGQNTLTSPLTFNDGTPLFVGSDHVGSNYKSANGTFQNFNIANNGKN